MCCACGLSSQRAGGALPAESWWSPPSGSRLTSLCRKRCVPVKQVSMALLPTARRALATRTAQKLDFRFYLFLHSWGKCLNVCLGFLQTQGLFLYVDLACILSAQEPNSPSCQKCPLNSTSKNTSGSRQLCQCAFGSNHQDVNGLSCQCRPVRRWWIPRASNAVSHALSFALRAQELAAMLQAPKWSKGIGACSRTRMRYLLAWILPVCKADGCAAGQF